MYLPRIDCEKTSKLNELNTASFATKSAIRLCNVYAFAPNDKLGLLDASMGTLARVCSDACFVGVRLCYRVSVPSFRPVDLVTVPEE